MNRDILKILLGGLLVLLFGILIIYVVLKGDQIYGWIKEKQGSPVAENIAREREIIPMDEVPSGKDLSPNQNFDSEPTKTKELPSEPSSQPLPKTDYEMPGLGAEKKETKTSKSSEKSDSNIRNEKKESIEREEIPSAKTRVLEDKIDYDDVPKYKKSKTHHRSKYKKTKRHTNVNARLSSLEKRVVRLEKKLGVKSSKTSQIKRKKLPLSKRVEILEKEISGLKKKSQAE